MLFSALICKVSPCFETQKGSSVIPSVLMNNLTLSAPLNHGQEFLRLSYRVFSVVLVNFNVDAESAGPRTKFVTIDTKTDSLLLINIQSINNSVANFDTLVTTNNDAQLDSFSLLNVKTHCQNNDIWFVLLLIDCLVLFFKKKTILCYFPKVSMCC